MLDGRVLEASQVEYKPFGKPPLQERPQAAADLVGAGAAGLAAVQALRSQLPQDAAEYVRMNVMPRSEPQPPHRS